MGMSSTSPPFIWLGFLVLGGMNLADGLLMTFLGAQAVQASILEQAGVTWSDLLSSNPALAHYVNTLVMVIGLMFTGFALFIVVVSLTGYRRAHRWAWYAMWNPAVFYLVLTGIFLSRGDVYTSDALSPEFLAFMLVASTLFQLMGYGAFFRKGAH